MHSKFFKIELLLDECLLNIILFVRSLHKIIIIMDISVYIAVSRKLEIL